MGLTGRFLLIRLGHRHPRDHETHPHLTLNRLLSSDAQEGEGIGTDAMIKVCQPHQLDQQPSALEPLKKTVRLGRPCGHSRR